MFEICGVFKTTTKYRRLVSSTKKSRMCFTERFIRIHWQDCDYRPMTTTLARITFQHHELKEHFHLVGNGFPIVLSYDVNTDLKVELDLRAAQLTSHYQTIQHTSKWCFWSYSFHSDMGLTVLEIPEQEVITFNLWKLKGVLQNNPFNELKS